MNKNNYIQQHNYFDELASKYTNLNSINISDLNTQNSVLLIVDMINGFTKTGAMASSDSLSINDDIAKLANEFDKRDIKIISFADCHNDDSVEFNSFPTHCLETSVESEVTDEIKNACNYKLIKKKSINGFFESEFASSLSENKHINNFIIVGCCTDFCVLNLALSLKIYHISQNINIDVTVLTDLTETFNSPTHNKDFWNIVSYSNMEQNGIKIIKNITY